MLSERKAFNFYRSYYEIALELPEKERLEYLMAIMKYQFTGEEPALEGMARFAFLSQKHSLQRQIEGYIAAVRQRQGRTDSRSEALPEESKKKAAATGSTLDEVRTAIFADEIFMEQVRRMFRDADIESAFEKCYMYHSNGMVRLLTVGEWKQKLISWLSNEKPKRKKYLNPGKL